MTSANVGGIGFLMQPSFSPLNKLEVLDGIGEIDFLGIDSEFSKDHMQKFSRRADKGMTQLVFDIARNLSHDHQQRPLTSFAENRLR